MRDSDVEYLRRYLPRDKFDEGIFKLKEGISPQYIVGNVDFYGNLIDVNENVLIPRFETELLVEKTLGYIKKLFGNSSINVLDIGTGSGCIAIALKKELDCLVTGVDISKGAIEVAKVNALKNGVDINFLVSDVFSSVDGVFDVIVSNPPYVSFDEEIDDIVRNNEPHLALFAEDNGLYFYNKILKGASVYLKDKFLIGFEIGWEQGSDIKRLVDKYFVNVNFSLEKDYSNRDRYVFIWRD